MQLLRSQFLIFLDLLYIYLCYVYLVSSKTYEIWRKSKDIRLATSNSATLVQVLKKCVVKKTSDACFGLEVNCFVAKCDAAIDYEDYGYNGAQNLIFGKRNSLKTVGIRLFQRYTRQFRIPLNCVAIVNFLSVIHTFLLIFYCNSYAYSRGVRSSSLYWRTAIHNLQFSKATWELMYKSLIYGIYFSYVYCGANKIFSISDGSKKTYCGSHI